MPDLHTTRVSLLRRIAAGPADPEAWSDFVATYGPAVIDWCRHHGLQDADAHDVAQEVLVRFWRHAARFRYDPSLRFRGYLRRMVVFAVSDWSESRRADRLGTGSDAVQGLLFDLAARDDIAHRVEDAYDTEALSLAMMRVERRVLPHTWQAFRLMAIERVPGEEVASRLGIGLNQAYRARSRVQQLIRETIESMQSPSAMDAGEPFRLHRP